MSTDARYAMVGINPDTKVVDVIARTDDCCASQLKYMQGLIVVICSGTFARRVWGKQVDMHNFINSCALGQQPINGGGTVDMTPIIQRSGTG